MKAAPKVKDLPRVLSDMPRLDYILRGGLLRGGTYSIVGPPGSGKTIFANQFCFNHARIENGRCVYLTLLAESHVKMFSHLKSLDFFDTALIPDNIFYAGAYQTLRDHGAAALLTLIRTTARQHNATALVIDGMQSLSYVQGGQAAFREFVHELQSFANLLGCTTLLLSTDVDLRGPESAVVDGCFELSDNLVGPRAVRELTVRKFRGSEHMRGKHEVAILPGGLVIHPRTEIQFNTPPSKAREERTRMAFGVPKLDAMLKGGIPSGSCVGLIGAPGTGKTMLGVAFLIEGARLGQRGTLFNFYEPPPRLIEKVESIGLPLGKYCKSGMIDIVWQPPLEHMLDSLAEQLLEPFRLHHEPRRRVFVDGLEGFRAASVYPRMSLFMSALTNQLRMLDATTIISEELALFAADLSLPNQEIATVVETVLLLRYVEVASRIERLISIMKMRESAYDGRIRRLEITAKGVRLGSVFKGSEGLLTGQPRVALPGGSS